MVGVDGVAFSEVRDRARDAQDAVMGAGGQTEPLEGTAENGRQLALFLSRSLTTLPFTQNAMPPFKGFPFPV